MPKKLLVPVTIALLFLTTTVKTHAGTTPPTTSLTPTPSSPNGNSSWYLNPVQIELQATDLESGVKETHYRVDGSGWTINEFQDALNLAPNPSFETAGSTTSGLDSWEATLVDSNVTHSQDTTVYATGYATASAKIETTDSIGIWHGINNASNFAVAAPLENMTASVWLKSDSLTEVASFSVYSLADTGPATLVTQSSTISGTTDWTQLTVNFAAPITTTGIYVDIGLTGAGTLWADAISISSAPLPTTTQFTVGSDGEHTIEYFSIDRADNVETTNQYDLKIDQTPPGNWHDSGALRWFWDPPYKLYVYITVQDPTSGLRWNKDGYKYHTELEEGFGRYSDLLDCGSTWEVLGEEDWIWAFTWWPFSTGAPETSLITPKTSFCNDNWRLCKAVKFRAEDVAGNVGTKEFCLNGPWIRFTGEAPVRTNNIIDMISEADGDNTDGLIEAYGSTIEFFTSSRDWEVTNSPIPAEYDYNTFTDLSDSPDTITDLQTSSGTYLIEGAFEITSGNLPGSFATDTFDQVVFVNGNLRISTDIDISDDSTVLFIVNGNVEIEKMVELVDIAIFAEGEFQTAYNIEEGDDTETLALNGIYYADKFVFQRTLQGTDNNDTPSEDFHYEAKYAIQLKDYLGGNTVTWLATE